MLVTWTWARNGEIRMPFAGYISCLALTKEQIIQVSARVASCRSIATEKLAFEDEKKRKNQHKFQFAFCCVRAFICFMSHALASKSPLDICCAFRCNIGDTMTDNNNFIDKDVIVPVLLARKFTSSPFYGVRFFTSSYFFSRFSFTLYFSIFGPHCNQPNSEL